VVLVVLVCVVCVIVSIVVPFLCVCVLEN